MLVAPSYAGSPVLSVPRQPIDRIAACPTGLHTTLVKAGSKKSKIQYSNTISRDDGRSHMHDTQALDPALRSANYPLPSPPLPPSSSETGRISEEAFGPLWTTTLLRTPREARAIWQLSLLLRPGPRQRVLAG